MSEKPKAVVPEEPNRVPPGQEPPRPKQEKPPVEQLPGKPRGAKHEDPLTDQPVVEGP